MSSKSVQNFTTQLRKSVPDGANESNEASFVGSGQVMGVSRKDLRPRRPLRGFFLATQLPMSIRQPLLQAGLTSQLPDQGKDYRDREKSLLFPSDAVLHVQVRADTGLCIKCTNSFQISGTERCLPRSLTQETGSVSSRVALPRLPRVEEGLHHRVSQLCGRADQLTTLLPMFFGINKIFREHPF